MWSNTIKVIQFNATACKIISNVRSMFQIKKKSTRAKLIEETPCPLFLSLIPLILCLPIYFATAHK